jgi:putative ABC transport system permease protein
LSDDELGKLKTIFWRNNVIGFAPFLDVPVTVTTEQTSGVHEPIRTTLIGTWYKHDVNVPNGGGVFTTGVSATDPGWRIEGRWFSEGSPEVVLGATTARTTGITVGQKLKLISASQLEVTVTGIASTGGQEDDAILAPLEIAQQLAGKPGKYRRLLVSALTKPEDAFSQRDPRTMTPEEFERWYCSPYISSISQQIREQLPNVSVRPIRQIAEGEGQILSRVQDLMWLVTIAALLAAALAVAATAGTTVLERTGEVALMEALGARRRLVGAFFLGEQWLMALAGGLAGYAGGLALAHELGQRVFGVSPSTRVILLPVILALAAAVATAGSLLSLRKVMRLDPAPVLRGE